MRTSKQQSRTVDDYLKLPYTVRVTADPTGGYVAAVEELPGCISQGETWDEVHAMIRDAMESWIAGALEDGEAVPVPEMDIRPARFALRLPRTLYRALTRKAETEGVSLNQYMVFVLASALATNQAEDSAVHSPSSATTRAARPRRATEDIDVGGRPGLGESQNVRRIARRYR
jgi:antitoxin HicB